MGDDPIGYIVMFQWYSDTEEKHRAEVANQLFPNLDAAERYAKGASPSIAVTIKALRAAKEQTYCGGHA